MNISSEIEYLDILSLPNHFTERSDMFLRKNIEDDDEEEYISDTIIQANYEEMENSQENLHHEEKENSSSCIREVLVKTHKRKIFAVKRLHRNKCIFKIHKTINGINLFKKGIINKDIPKKIVGYKLQEDSILCKIEWNKNEEGIQPASSYISNTLLKEVVPDLLIKYYETIIDNFL